MKMNETNKWQSFTSDIHKDRAERINSEKYHPITIFHTHIPLNFSLKGVKSSKECRLTNSIKERIVGISFQLVATFRTC